MKEMSAFIRDVQVHRKDAPELKDYHRKLNVEMFKHQIKNSTYIPMIKYIFLAFCFIMWVGGIILVNEKIINIADISIKEGNLTLSGMILSNFMHIHIIHFAMNMTAMVFLFNRFFFANYKILLALVVLSAIGSTFLSIQMLPKDAILIGSSGILYGILTFYMLYLNDLRQVYNVPDVNSKIKKFLLIQTVISVMINFIPMVGWYAHLGGAVMGLILYFIVRKSLDFSAESLTLTYYKI
jgi:membrane associated rhomboid family serine protease